MEMGEKSVLRDDWGAKNEEHGKERRTWKTTGSWKNEKAKVNKDTYVRTKHAK